MSLFYTRRTVDGITATRRMKRVLLVLLTDAANLGGYSFTQAAEIGYGALYVCLARLCAAGWVASEWEEGVKDRPRRRFYRLTPQGWINAHALLGLEMSEVRRG